MWSGIRSMDLRLPRGTTPEIPAMNMRTRFRFLAGSETAAVPRASPGDYSGCRRADLASRAGTLGEAVPGFPRLRGGIPRLPMRVVRGKHHRSISAIRHLPRRDEIPDRREVRRR